MKFSGQIFIYNDYIRQKMLK